MTTRLTPADVHPSHDVREEGWLVSDPVCQHCRCSTVYRPHHAMLVTPCQGGYRPGEPTVADGQMAKVWWDAAPAGEREAMRRIVACAAPGSERQNSEGIEA